MSSLERIHIDAIVVESARLFAKASGNGRQMILDVAVTGLGGQSRPTNDSPDRHLQVQSRQKMAKCRQIGVQNRLHFVPAIFFHKGQIHRAFKSELKEQIRQKLIHFEGHTKPSKIKSVMKWWSKCISMIIAKTAGRNVAFKAANMGESAFAGQSGVVLTPEVMTATRPTIYSQRGRRLHVYISLDASLDTS